MMPRASIFTNSILRKKKKKFSLFWSIFKRIALNNPKLFIINTFLAITVAVINFNIRLNLKMAFSERPKDTSLLTYKGFKFFFHPKILFVEKIGFWPFFLSFLFLFVVGKGIFSILHYYWMNYSYSWIENDLLKDLFSHFIQAKYYKSSQISREIPSFHTLLDRIARDSWLIINRSFYVLTSLVFLIIFDLLAVSRSVGGGLMPRFSLIVISLFIITFVVQYFLFKKSAQLSISAKKRRVEENTHLLERVINLEHVKTNSGEIYEKEKLDKLLDKNFQKDKKSLLWNVFFQAFPAYFLIPGINIFFILLAGLSTLIIVPGSAEQPLFFIVQFTLIHAAISDLRAEIDKVIQSLANLDDLFTNFNLIFKSIKIIQEKEELPAKIYPSLPFVNGDIVFENVNFAYPSRPNSKILQNFSAHLEQGKIYWIAGRNGAGKSTIAKTILKLYDIQQGKILINSQEIKEINNRELSRNVCYLTNKSPFFPDLSIEENIFYPDRKGDLSKLLYASKMVETEEFIKSLPEGFKTVLREKDGGLSEGQKQRISAMRLFIFNYKIVIIDEAFSNIQNNSKIYSTVLEHLKNKTTVIIIDHSPNESKLNMIDKSFQFSNEGLTEIKKENLIA